MVIKSILPYLEDLWQISTNNGKLMLYLLRMQPFTLKTICR
ncbi:hypothetical protein RintRC_0551 [Richelia intracellularis]|nr:hypothetical protein RintRC_0551 [Richelia intracellularis]